MGVEIADAGKVARLLGIKVFVDEFISFRDLGIMVQQGNIAVSMVIMLVIIIIIISYYLCMITRIHSRVDQTTYLNICGITAV